MGKNRNTECNLDMKPGETLIPGGEGGEAFHPGIGYASYLM